MYIRFYTNLVKLNMTNMRYISDRKHELLKCVGTLLAKQERKFKGKRVTILGYDESKRAIILKDL